MAKGIGQRLRVLLPSQASWRVCVPVPRAHGLVPSRLPRAVCCRQKQAGQRCGAAWWAAPRLQAPSSQPFGCLWSTLGLHKPLAVVLQAARVPGLARLGQIPDSAVTQVAPWDTEVCNTFSHHGVMAVASLQCPGQRPSGRVRLL